MRRLLVVDRQFATDHQLPDTVELFPRPDNSPSKWSLPFENNSVYTREIVQAKDRLAALFSERIYARNFAYRREAMDSFYNCLGYVITFLIGDRLLRLNRLFGEISPADVLLPQVQYRHDPTTSANDFFYKKVEGNPYFNQWVVNTLLPHLEQVPLPMVKQNLLGQESVYIGKLQRIKEQVRTKWLRPTELLRDSWRYLARKAIDGTLQDKLAFELTKHGRDLPCEHEALQIQNLRRKSLSFFWPIGRLSPIRATLPKGNENLFSPTFRRSDFAGLDREVAQIFNELLVKTGESIHLPHRSFLAIAPLISELLPSVVVEEVEVHASRFLEEMSRFRGDCFICGSTYGGYDAAFHTFAAKELGKKVVSIQHSGWGGYLADGALISEILIAGCDNYVTFGWTNKDPNLSTWIDRPVVLPSPMLSEFQRRSALAGRKESRTKLPARKSILLSTAFVYRFPSVYNSFLRVDTLGQWAAIIEDVLQKLARHDLKITLIMYNSTVASLHRPILDRWLAIDQAKIREHPDHDVRVRRMMESGEFQNEFDAVIWDLPAGGFSEALYCGIPTFSLWDTRLIKALDFAKPFIADLQNAGILFSNGDDIAKTMTQFYTVPGWYDAEAVQKPLAAFADNFLLADSSWHKPWAEFLRSI